MQLLGYVKRHENDAAFEKYIENQQSFLLYDYYKEKHLDRICFIMDIESKRQNALHEILYKEAEKIYDFANSNGIRVVGMKGLFLEKEYYTPQHEQRYYHDMDLLVDDRDVAALSRFFINDSGYTLVKPTQNIERWRYKSKKNMTTKKFEKYKRRNHIFLVKKCANNVHANISQYIEIEIHTDLNFTFQTSFNHDELLNRIVQKQTKDFFYYSLNDIDQILYLCFHAAKHLPYVFLYPGSLCVDLQKVYDIALIANEFQYDWERVFELAIEYRILPHVLLILRLCADIFPGLFPKSVICKYANLVTPDFYWYNIYKYIMRIQPSKILSGNLEDIPEINTAYKEIVSRFGAFDDRGNNVMKKTKIWKKAFKDLLK